MRCYPLSRGRAASAKGHKRRSPAISKLSAFSPKAVLVWRPTVEIAVISVRHFLLSRIPCDKPMNEALSAKKISGGVVHDLPADLKKALTSDAKALETWEDITPLARNEWICWIESAKKTGNKNSSDRMGLFQPQRRKAKTLLLAWLSASLRSSRHPTHTFCTCFIDARTGAHVIGFCGSPIRMVSGAKLTRNFANGIANEPRDTARYRASRDRMVV